MIQKFPLTDAAFFFIRKPDLHIQYATLHFSCSSTYSVETPNTTFRWQSGLYITPRKYDIANF